MTGAWEVRGGFQPQPKLLRNNLAVFAGFDAGSGSASHVPFEQIFASMGSRTAMSGRKTLECPPPPVSGKGAASYAVGKPGRPSHFDEAKFRDVLNEFGGSLTRENEQEVAAKMAAGIRTVWRWWKSLSNK